MCLILFALDVSPRFPLIMAANRDEFYHRPATPMDFWPKPLDILAGKDVSAGGTWFGITRSGKFAALTNFRDPSRMISQAPTRGEIITDLLSSDRPLAQGMDQLFKCSARYNGFNLLAGSPQGNQLDLCWFSNQGKGVEKVDPGIHGLSNAFLDTPWPKIQRGKQMLTQLIQAGQEGDDQALFQLLADTKTPGDDELPHTGVGLEWERVLSPLFIQSPTYGTRASTLVRMDNTGCFSISERSYDPTDVTRFTDRNFTIDPSLP